MLWIIVSGALHNFNMYAIGGFLTPFTMRVHGKDVQFAGYVSMAVYGLAGIPGMILGGLLGDFVIRRWRNGRMLVAAVAIAISVPVFYFAIGQSEWFGFGMMFGFGCMLLYMYYGTVYSTIQDVIEPSLRATAMALYFCAMYAFGGAAGPIATGFLSEYFTNRAATVAGVELDGLEESVRYAAIEPYRAEGISTAMYVLPAVGGALALSLFAGAMTVRRDVDKLHDWMREASEAEAAMPKPEKVTT